MRTVIGVMGGGHADTRVAEDARRLGSLIASHGWVLLTGGRACGVMDAASRGAREAGGLVVGVLPSAEAEGVSEHVDVAVLTGMGDARNCVNVLTSAVVVAFPGGAGTLSEIALALKAGRPVVTVGFPLGDAFAPYRASGRLSEASGPDEALAIVARLLPRAAS